MKKVLKYSVEGPSKDICVINEGFRGLCCCSSHFSSKFTFQNIRESPWSLNCAHSSPKGNWENKVHVLLDPDTAQLAFFLYLARHQTQQSIGHRSFRLRLFSCFTTHLKLCLSKAVRGSWWKIQIVHLPGPPRRL